MATRLRMVPAPIARLRAPQVNLLLEALVLMCLATGGLSWMVGTGWARWLTVTHAVCGISILVIAPAKMQRSVKTGLRRRRATRWLSIAFGALVVVTATVGILHASGLWYGVGLWSALWIHVTAALLAIPFFVWHVTARPVKLRRVDADRRLLLGAGAMTGIAAVVYGVQEVASRTLTGSGRRFTGSREVGSFEPEHMPGISWLDDEKPSVEAVARWTLSIGGQPFDLGALRADTEPVEATLDCTGGWWSTQRWDAVPLSRFTSTWTSRSVRITSSTGYSRILPRDDADRLFLAVGYSGEPLRRKHGAPVRLLAPGRRGPWWVKWVVSVEPDDRPWWLQLPFPAT